MTLANYCKKRGMDLEGYELFQASFDRNREVALEVFINYYKTQYGANSGIFIPMNYKPTTDLDFIFLNALKEDLEIKDYNNDGMMYYRI